MTKRLIAVEEELLPQIRSLTKGDSIEPTTKEVTPATVVVFNVKHLIQAMGAARGAMMIRQFSTQMRASLKNDLGVDVPVVCITEDNELSTFPPDYMRQFGWLRVDDR